MSFDWSVYTGNLEWLPTNTLFLTKHGSHAYGTSLPTSDLDLRGICIPPRQYYFGFGSFEQTCQTEPDLTVFELRKFMRLAADCNPNAIEILFTDPSDHLVVSPQLEILLEHRDDFLSTKALHTFSGYAASQLHRINLHYKWLKDPPKAPPTRSEFGLTDPPEIPKNQMEAAMAQIKKKLSHWNWHELDNLDDAQRICVQDEFTRILAEITQWGWQEKEDQLWRSAANSLGFETNFLQVLDCERRYNAKLNNWKNYQTWLKSRNPARAELEAKHKFDTKHASHLVRLMRMCREILTTGQVLVRRPDAEELLSIRNGAWTYEQLIAWSEKQDEELKEVAKTSKLPWSANRVKLEKIMVEMIWEFIK